MAVTHLRVALHHKLLFAQQVQLFHLSTSEQPQHLRALQPRTADRSPEIKHKFIET